MKTETSIYTRVEVIIQHSSQSSELLKALSTSLPYSMEYHLIQPCYHYYVKTIHT